MIKTPNQSISQSMNHLLIYLTLTMSRIALKKQGHDSNMLSALYSVWETELTAAYAMITEVRKQ